jgi:hypothetical protein
MQLAIFAQVLIVSQTFTQAYSYYCGKGLTCIILSSVFYLLYVLFSISISRFLSLSLSLCASLQVHARFDTTAFGANVIDAEPSCVSLALWRLQWSLSITRYCSQSEQ